MRVIGGFRQLSIKGDRVQAFVPAPLPPSKPPLNLEPRAVELLELGMQRLRELDAVCPSPFAEWLGPALGRVEALASFRLDGAPPEAVDGPRPTLLDLLAHEAGIRDSDTDAVLGVTYCLEALSYCRTEVQRRDGARVSVRLFNQAQRRLVRRPGGAIKPRGLLRSIPVWIGGTRPSEAAYVPPPPFDVPALLEDLEHFLSTPSPLPPLVRIALAHAQFETIRPYLVGNGRIARLILPALLQQWQLLQGTVLPLSLFFERHRDAYQRHLIAVRSTGDWESWILFFLEGVAAMAAEALAPVRGLVDQVIADHDRVLRSPFASVAGLRLLAQLRKHPLVSVPQVAKLLGATAPTAAKAVALLESLGILEQVAGRHRYRAFGYKGFAEHLPQ